MEFRPATVDDVPFAESLLKEFYAKTDAIEYAELPYDEPSAIASVQGVIEDGVCLVGPNSCAGAIFLPCDVNYNLTLAWVAFWAFRRHREIVILKALMDACRARGATHFIAASHFPHNRVMPYYQKLGLKPFEIQSICRL